MKKFPTVIYVEHDPNDDSTESLIAWTKVSSIENGAIAVYTLTSELEKRAVVEVRRKGTKTWTKASR